MVGGLALSWSLNVCGFFSSSATELVIFVGIICRWLGGLYGEILSQHLRVDSGVSIPEEERV